MPDLMLEVFAVEVHLEGWPGVGQDSAPQVRCELVPAWDEGELCFATEAAALDDDGRAVWQVTPAEASPPDPDPIVAILVSVPPPGGIANLAPHHLSVTIFGAGELTPSDMLGDDSSPIPQRSADVPLKALVQAETGQPTQLYASSTDAHICMLVAWVAAPRCVRQLVPAVPLQQPGLTPRARARGIKAMPGPTTPRTPAPAGPLGPSARRPAGSRPASAGPTGRVRGAKFMEHRTSTVELGCKRRGYSEHRTQDHHHKGLHRGYTGYVGEDPQAPPSPIRRRSCAEEAPSSPSASAAGSPVTAAGSPVKASRLLSRRPSWTPKMHSEMARIRYYGGRGKGKAPEMIGKMYNLPGFADPGSPREQQSVIPRSPLNATMNGLHHRWIEPGLPGIRVALKERLSARELNAARDYNEKQIRNWHILNGHDFAETCPFDRFDR